jgi:hypothetical protein
MFFSKVLYSLGVFSKVYRMVLKTEDIRFLLADNRLLAAIDAEFIQFVFRYRIAVKEAHS